MCMQVESDHNIHVILDFLASFADDIPPSNDIKDMRSKLLKTAVHV